MTNCHLVLIVMVTSVTKMIANTVRAYWVSAAVLRAL